MPPLDTEDMAIGRSFQARFDSIVTSPGPYKDWTPADDATELLDDMYEDVLVLREHATDLAASLAAAISLLERGAKEFKKGAASDTMFDVMLDDYRNSLEKYRSFLNEKDHQGV